MLTRRSVMSRPCLSRRRMVKIRWIAKERQEEGGALLDQSRPNHSSKLPVPFRIREAQPFPLWTLVLASFARSRHNRPVCLRAESSRNLGSYYKRRRQVKGDFVVERRFSSPTSHHN